jgi:hypothetical protein
MKWPQQATDSGVIILIHEAHLFFKKRHGIRFELGFSHTRYKFTWLQAFTGFCRLLSPKEATVKIPNYTAFKRTGDSIRRRQKQLPPGIAQLRAYRDK